MWNSGQIHRMDGSVSMIFIVVVFIHDKSSMRLFESTVNSRRCHHNFNGLQTAIR
jgi:hypothetical protein